MKTNSKLISNHFYQAACKLLFRPSIFGLYFKNSYLICCCTRLSHFIMVRKIGYPTGRTHLDVLALGCIGFPFSTAVICLITKKNSDLSFLYSIWLVINDSQTLCKVPASGQSIKHCKSVYYSASLLIQTSFILCSVVSYVNEKLSQLPIADYI